MTFVLVALSLYAMTWVVLTVTEPRSRTSLVVGPSQFGVSESASEVAGLQKAA